MNCDRTWTEIDDGGTGLNNNRSGGGWTFEKIDTGDGDECRVRIANPVDADYGIWKIKLCRPKDGTFLNECAEGDYRLEGKY